MIEHYRRRHRPSDVLADASLATHHQSYDAEGTPDLEDPGALSPGHPVNGQFQDFNSTLSGDNNEPHDDTIRNLKKDIAKLQREIQEFYQIYRQINAIFEKVAGRSFWSFT